MASYSTDANVQNLAYGATNSDLDTATTAARDAATSIINAKLNIQTDISSPSNSITRACTLIAAAILVTGPQQNLEENAYYKAGIALLEEAKGDATADAHWRRTIISRRH